VDDFVLLAKEEIVLLGIADIWKLEDAMEWT
jgi:hypothetical protein